MSHENMPQEPHSQEKKWSTKKKWVVGCSGCLGVVVLLVAGIGVLAGMGVNSLMQVSNEAVGSIFGPSYKPANYMAMGLPISSKSMQGMAMLINQRKGSLVFAVQTKLPEDQLAILRSGQLQQMQTVVKKLADDAIADSQQRESSSGKLQSFRLDKIYNLSLAPNKIYTVCNATLEVEKRGAVSYSPTSVALIPEANDSLVVLATFSSSNTSTSADTHFDSEQNEMQQEVLQVIKDSELDDRLIATKSAAQSEAKPAQPTTAGR